MTASTSAQTPISRIIVLLALAAFASTSAFRVLDPALPQLAQEFSITTGQAADVVKVFALAYGVLQFFWGPIADRFGKFRTLAWATLACAAGNLFIVFAGSFDAILIGRIMAGATAAAIVPLSMAWIGDHVPYEQRQATLAQFMTGTILGLTSGLVVGGVLTDTLGWRASFVLLAGVYTLIGLLLLSQQARVPESTGQNNTRLRLIGPIVQVLREPWARMILVVVLLEGALVFGVMSFVPAYLQQRHDISSTSAGLLTSLFGLGSLIYVAKARWLIAKLGESRMVWIGGWLMGTGYAAYALGDYWWVAIGASIGCGFSYYLVHAVLQTNATQMVPAVRGTAVSLFASCLFGGQAIGVALGAMVVDHVGIIWVIGVGAVMMPFLGMFFSWRLGLRERQEKPST